MHYKRSVTDRALAMLLSLVLCLTMVPQMVFATADTSGAASCVAVKAGAETAYETTTGAYLPVSLDQLFTDSDGHTLTYTLSDGDYGTQTKLAKDADGKDILSFTNPDAGTYTPTITASCPNGGKASVQLTITVEQGEAGDASQYGYDETPAKSVKVYVTIASDGVPLKGIEGTVLSHLEVDVPYFDLAYQGLSEFYRYHTENGEGSYIDDVIVERPTALHLYLYMIGVYYLGLTPEEITSGEVQILNHAGGAGVTNMFDSTPYADNRMALYITGSATSMYMQQFWGHDENLMYYRNHVYPLKSAGWGSTADYVLLSDGDTIDLSMFTDWSFWHDGGAFAAFDRDDYTVSAGDELTFKTLKYDTKSVADGGTEQFDPITGLDMRVYDEDWQQIDAVTPGDDESTYTYTFDEAGTYYLLGIDPNAGTKDARFAPATAKVTVESKTVPVPTRKADYPAASEATVKTGMAYLLSDLQAGKVFAPVDGQRLTYANYYYQRSTDGGKTWGSMQHFSESLFGGTTIQLTELSEGDYTYRFYASHDGENFSEDTWTLTLHVQDSPAMNFTFFVGKDYTGSYPVIRLYNVDEDGEGNEVLGDAIENCFRYSDFTDTLPEGQDAYDPAAGLLTGGYQVFYASLKAGRYAYRAFAENADTGAYDVALGGMTLDLPTDTNVDGGAGGGTNIYLRCGSFCVDSKKTDGTYFAADEYHVRVDCPIMGTACAMGKPYTKGSYTYYPTVLYAAGNACLYNSYAYPDIDGYVFTQNINRTFSAGSGAFEEKLTINAGVELTVTVPDDTDFGLYFQWNNFNTTEVAPVNATEDFDGWSHKENGTKSAVYFISKGNGNYTWRLSDATHVTRAGWLTQLNAREELSFSFDAGAATDRLSHDFSNLGSQTVNRDEADLQVNLDPSGYKALNDTTRVRAYRHWQLINNDAGNIMVEPDFHWDRQSGDAEIETVNGGNTTANWADITPGTQDSIITVYYDSVDVNPGSYGSHGGLYPATQPQRVGVIVVGGTGVEHGTADADVDFNMAAGATTTRSVDWDYNYDTWYYEAGETDPTLTFAVVKNTGDVTVDYAFVATDNAMVTTVSDFRTISAGADGRYTVPLADFNDLGNGMGGTVILRMTDNSGVSYRLVRVAKVTITSENASHKGEDIMPGDQVKLTFSGMFRGVNKISGIFNPTTFMPTYYAGDTKCVGALGQYQRMDNASVSVTLPADIAFEDGQETTTYTFTNGYTYGSMYSAANPFAFLYGMTDTGVGTNFNAVIVNYYMNHYADAVVTVHRKVFYDVALDITDAGGTALSGVTIALTDSSGKAVAANENGRFQLGYDTYNYVLTKDGYVVTRSSFTLSSADADKVQDGILTIKASMDAAGAAPWDGTTRTEPAKDDDGVYLIGTGAELAWFAANGGEDSARLTADIELAGYDWTPMNKFYGTFDGQGHVIRNLYVNSSSYPLGLFGYLQSGASVTKLGITGDVTCTARSNAQAGGIAGYMNSGTSITSCWSAVNVTTKKHGGGIAGYTAKGAAITDCYATGTIRTTSANECYLGGICASFYSNTDGAALTNCYSIATVVGSGGNASYVGGLSPVTNGQYYVNSYYLEGTVSGESPKYRVTGRGTAKTADELKALASELGSSFAADTKGLNDGYPILTWQVVAEPELTGLKITTPPTKTEYLPGEDFEPAGMTVVAVYDGVTEVEVTDYTVEDGEALKAEATAVTVKYGGFTAQQAITMLVRYDKGDVNNDGVVDDADAAMVYAFANAKLTADARQADAADINGDGAVTAADAEIIYSFYLGELASLTAHN